MSLGPMKFSVTDPNFREDIPEFQILPIEGTAAL